MQVVHDDIFLYNSFMWSTHEQQWVMQFQPLTALSLKLVHVSDSSNTRPEC